MLDEVKDQLRVIYNRINGRVANILEVFVNEFGEANTDTNICTFEGFLNKIGTKTLGQMGISQFSDSNSYGGYHIDVEDYETNGRGKPLLEYVPDLGILDYLTPVFKNMIVPSSNYHIIVHFPNVRVTNEYDKFIDIQDLYAKVLIDHDGKLVERFKMTRTTYPFTHFKSGYAHSHLPVFNSTSIANWEYPCTGTGPIVDTQNTLRRNCDINIWGLFAFELSKYVTIESIAGTPYIRLESVGKGDIADGMYNLIYNGFSVPHRSMKTLMDRFVLYYARSGKFRVRFVNGGYQLGESPVNAIVNISNAFIDWYNSIATHSIAGVPTLTSMKSSGILKEYIVSNNNIYDISSSNGRDLSSAQHINGKSLFDFKGETVRLKILIDSHMTNDNKSLLLAKGYCEYAFARALAIINYKYGKRTNQRGSGSQTEAQSQAEAVEKPYFV